MVCRSCSFVCRLHHLIIIIMQTYLKALNYWNACQVYDADWVSKIKKIISIIFYSIYRAVCLQLTQFSCDDRENVYFILLSSSNWKYESLTIVYGEVMKQWYALYVLLCSYWYITMHKMPGHLCFITVTHVEIPIHLWVSKNISVLIISLTLSQWSSSGNPVAIQCAWHLDPSVHWNATGERILVASVLPVVFQWSSSGFPVVFQCVPIMQINTGSPLGHHWVLASASVVPVASHCTCGSSGLPVCSNYAN